MAKSDLNNSFQTKLLENLEVLIKSSINHKFNLDEEVPWINIVRNISFALLLLSILENILGKIDFISIIIMSLLLTVLNSNNEKAITLNNLNTCFRLNIFTVIYDIIYLILVSMINI